MNKLLRLYVKLKCRIEGATAIEYALLVTLIAIAIILALTAVGDALNFRFGAVATAISS